MLRADYLWKISYNSHILSIYGPPVQHNLLSRPLPKLVCSRSHYVEKKASFIKNHIQISNCHSNVSFNLFKETHYRLFVFMAFYSIFNVILILQVSFNQVCFYSRFWIFTNTTRKPFSVMPRQCLSKFASKNRRKSHRCDYVFQQRFLLMNQEMDCGAKFVSRIGWAFSKEKSMV